MKIMEWFYKANEKDADFLQENSECQIMACSTTNWLHVYQCWVQTRKLNENLHSYEPDKLNKILEHFMRKSER